ncbi:MAG: peptidyl-prolyl cis-trans isomerase [Candidatus Hydrogenedentes bacterium]|nr:peptidyl-prolyl cis-trans isomerase [Candidatus Hydrogenedentota bacterium]
MSKPDPERLNEFRSQYQTAAGPSNFLAIVQTAILIAGFAGLFFLATRSGAPQNVTSTPNGGAGGLTPELSREYAQYLEQKGLRDQAISAYESYLEKASLDPKTRASICYSVASLASAEEQFEKALAYLYQAEMLAPQSELKSEIDKKVTSCLEKLGRTSDLKRELRQRTMVKRTAAQVQPGEKVLAEWSGEVFTDRDLDAEIVKLPAPLQEAFSKPEKRADLLKNLLVERLLTDKAYRLELNKDPEFEAALARERDALMVRKLIESEVRAKTTVTPEDVERYYRAEIDRFTEPATARVVVGTAATEEAAKGLTDFSKEAVTVRKGSPVPGISGSEAAGTAIFEAETDSIAKPIQIADKWYVFKVLAKTDAKVLPFDQVKSRAESSLRMQKEQEQFRALVEETLKANNVQLYPERLQEAS